MRRTTGQARGDSCRDHTPASSPRLGHFGVRCEWAARRKSAYAPTRATCLSRRNMSNGQSRQSRAQCQRADPADDLLDVSRIATGACRPSGVIEGALDAFRPAAEGKRCAADCARFRAAPIVGGRDRLRHVIWKLVLRERDGRRLGHNLTAARARPPRETGVRLATFSVRPRRGGRQDKYIVRCIVCS